MDNTKPSNETPIWESNTLNEKQSSEVNKVLSLPNGTELIRFYQERLKYGYYVDKHDTYYTSNEDVLKGIELSPTMKKLPYYVHRITSTLFLHRPENGDKCIEVPPPKYPQGAYISPGIPNPDDSVFYRSCGNALMAYGKKYLCLTTTASSHTLSGQELYELYKRGTIEIKDRDGKLVQTITVIPTKLFLNMKL